MWISKKGAGTHFVAPVCVDTVQIYEMPGEGALGLGAADVTG